MRSEYRTLLYRTLLEKLKRRYILEYVYVISRKNTKWDLKDTRCEGMDWFHLTQDGDQ
jgi:hypothetical protein